MAELRISVGLNNVTRNLDYQQKNVLVTTSSNERAAGDLSVTTSEVTLDLSSLVADYGWGRFRNLDTTNFVKMGFETGAYNLRLKPSHPGILLSFEPTETILYFIADTATCSVEYELFGE